MRYLVKAKLKSGKSKSLLRSINERTLGKGSIAGDEYIYNMNEARLSGEGVATWVETCFCDPALAEERPYWEEYFELVSVKGRSLASKLPARERHRTLGMLRLRLHKETGREIARPGPVISRDVAFVAQRDLKGSKFQPPTSKEIPNSNFQCRCVIDSLRLGNWSFLGVWNIGAWSLV